MSKYKISICIPAYKRIHYLQRLLESIIIQTFKEVEVIVSDDSNDDSVLQLINHYSGKVDIQYYKNEKALGTPGNWNFAISKASGEWIKLMHDDDWFASADSLALFAEQTKKGNQFIFSAYNNCFEGTDGIEKKRLPFMAGNRIIKYPVTLLAHNVIGPPSVTLVHRSIAEKYDERMKWRVDIDFYIRVLKLEKSYGYINRHLINVGVSESQVTNECINIPSVELPEGYLLLKKYGTGSLRHILVYDAWWRILRNMEVVSKGQLEQYGQKEWPPVIISMVRSLSHWPHRLLKTGIISKFIMSCSWCCNLLKSNF